METTIIKIEYNKSAKIESFSSWVDPKRLKKYTLPSFTKKIFTHLENYK